ncbi:MAG: tetratricopeptide repeat protein [Vicingus serpentipes]|nr:tetratricopeptide repeat protein [Vicingus serpentipes]
MKKNLSILFIVTVIITGFLGCSRKKNSFTRRAYHNTTARYNGYFNAREIKKENVATLYNEYKDDYSEILPLFIYPDEVKSKSMYPDMDKIIEKCSEVIDRHSMYIKKEEHNRWIDDCYLLIGQARFYKQEYFVGEEIFIYVAKTFKNNPSKYEGLMWLIRTYMEVGEMQKAESYLDVIDQEGIPKQYSSEYHALYAEYYIRKKNYDEAINKLTKALETTRKKSDQRRFNYVLAQLWLKKKEYGQASALFTKVIKLKPEYSMMFHAKINRALSYDVGGEDNKAIKKMLTKMVRDTKNAEYLDQIYYALADIAFKENDEDLGIEYLQKSAAASTSNTKQKALSYLRLGELFYEKPQYVLAQSYYDSCLTVLPKDYSDYDKIYERNNALTKLVTNIKIVEEQDSLLKMSTDEEYRKKVINQLVQKAIDEEAKLKQQANTINTPTGVNLPTNTTKGGWYFYNKTTLGFGFTDFRKKWGDRKLEDDWRRKDKQSVATFNEEAAKIDSSSTDSTVVNEKTNPDYYLQFIPTTDADIIASHNKIIEALYALGNIYREDFQNYPGAINSFEELITRYDTSHYKLPSWYNLYRISLLIENDEMKTKYRNLILNNYPESEYAKIIQDPTYNKVTRENRKRVDNYYSRVFELYTEKYYDNVLIRCEKAKAIFADNHIQDKFDFLAAMSIGHTNTLDSFKLALEDIIIKHPKSDVSDEAKRILTLIEKDPRALSSGKTSFYQHDPTDDFVFVAVIPTTDNKTPKYKIAISDFNQKYYSANSFEPIQSILLNKDRQIITVKKFKGNADAIDYYKSFVLNKDNLKELNEKKYDYFLISEKNFVHFYGDKDVAAYLEFFRKNFDIKL